MSKLHRKIALVTGGGTGVGLAAARALAEKDFEVIISGRRKDTLDDAMTSLPKDRVHAIVCDIVDPASVEKLFEEIEQRFGRLDLLFNNAGRGAPPISVEDIPLDLWKSVIDTNLTGSLLCAQAAIRLMKRQTPRGGRIINNGSVSATYPRLYGAAYTASKHAITGLTKSIALDCREYDITCGQIDIGNATTELSGIAASGALQPDGSLRTEAMMDTKNVGDAIAYMASLPLDANTLFLTVHATKMPLIGRG